MHAQATGADPLDRNGYDLDFEEAFSSPELDRSRWVPHYLPHWTTPDRSAARYDLADGGLVLHIDAEQPAWRLEDGELRVSNLQTGSFSGPAGSGRGTHRHRPDLRVVTPQRRWRGYTPTSGLVEARLRAVADPNTMLACWLVGLEDRDRKTGEVAYVRGYRRRTS